MKLFALLAAVAAASPVVNLGYSQYQGVSEDTGISKFLGMRYAAAPVGNNRLRKPQEPKHEHGVIKADKHGPICAGVQNLSFPAAGFPESEDCLTINVFTPSNALHSEDKKLPVMLWFQGGAFVQMFNPDYDGTSLIKASHDELIVVTFGYRVGAFGFLASEELANEGNLNLGLHDQRAAVAWVRKHISTFGGDPEAITLFGTSVGAGSILMHTLIGADAEFDSTWKRGIASAPYVPPVYPVSELKSQYQTFLKDTGCKDLACLRSLSSDEFAKGNVIKPQLPQQKGIPLFPWSPALDGDLFTDTPLAMLKQGKLSRKHNLIIGTSDTEGTLFASKANTTQDIDDFLQLQFPHLGAPELPIARGLYSDVPHTLPGVQVPLAPEFLRNAKMYGDIAYSSPALQFASALSVENKVYLFRDNIRDPVNVEKGLIVPHTWEVEAVWGGKRYGPQHAKIDGANSYDAGGVNHAIIPVIQKLYTSFATRGSPGLEWTPYHLGGQRLKFQTNDTKMEPVPVKDHVRSAFWLGMSGKTRI